jgi:hypothetical protein
MINYEEVTGTYGSLGPCHYLCCGPDSCPYWEWKHNTELGTYYKYNICNTWVCVMYSEVPELIRLRFKLGI